MTFSNNRLFSLNLTFPNVPEYPHIFKNILDLFIEQIDKYTGSEYFW